MSSSAAIALQQRSTAPPSQSNSTAAGTPVMSKRTSMTTVANGIGNGNENGNGISTSGRDEESQQLIGSNEANSRKNNNDSTEIGADDPSDISEEPKTHRGRWYRHLLKAHGCLICIMFSTALSLIIAGIVIMVERSRYGAYPGADPDKGPDISEICLNLPLVYLKTEKGIDELEHFERQTASIQIKTKDGTAFGKEIKFNTSHLDEELPAHKIGLKFRGRDSFQFPKKGFDFRFEGVRRPKQDASETPVDVSILGLKKGDQFWLRSCYLDPSFLRDTMTTWLAQTAADSPTKGPERWIPQVKFVEVAIDGKYQGVYLMYEAIKEGTNRLPLTLSKNSSVPDPKSVGYSLEWGGYKPFYKRWARDYPDSEDFSDERRESITQLLEDIDELEAEAKTGGVKMEALDSKLDLDSFIDSFIVEEIAKDWDYRLGSYLFFYPGGSNPKIFAAPPWDFDRAYANNLGVPTTEIYNHEGFAFGFAFEEEEHLRWWPHFLLVPGIAARISSRWKELRLGALSDNKINSQIKSFESQLAPAMLSNFERWPVLGLCNARMSLDYHPPECFPETFGGVVLQLKTWINSRVEWLDSQLWDWDDDKAAAAAHVKYRSHQSKYLLRKIGGPIAMLVCGLFFLTIGILLITCKSVRRWFKKMHYTPWKLLFHS